MAAEYSLWWFLEHVRDGARRVFGSLAVPAGNLTSTGDVFKPDEVLSVPAGAKTNLWTYEATNQGDTDSLNEFGCAIISVDQASEGGVYLNALVGKKNATTNLPDTLATNGRWQQLGWIPCGGVYVIPSMIAQWTPNDGTDQDSEYPAISDDADAVEGRIYRLSVSNPGTEAVTVRTLLV